MASVTDPAWTAGANSDRLEVLLAAIRVTGHGSQNITHQVGEEDDFVDGPWPKNPNAIMFGMPC
jgi:hypothetical protein